MKFNIPVVNIIKSDCIEYMKHLNNNSIDLIITSPPYNLGNKKSGDIQIDSYDDNLNENEYQLKQIEFLNECYRILKATGAIFYNHKNRYKKGELIVPYQWILRTKMKIKQEIIWNRCTTADREQSKFAPLDEKIYWLYKDKTFRLKKGAQNFTNIWNIKRPRPKDNYSHKATFPYQLIFRIINSLNLPNNTIIMDPYAGTGTVGQVANNLNYRFIMVENLDKWIKVIKNKVKIKNDFYEPLPTIKKPYLKEVNNGLTNYEM